MTTISLARMANVDFSVPIYVDGGAVLVGTRSKLAKLADLKGKRIAVIPGTTTEQALARTLSAIDAPVEHADLDAIIDRLADQTPLDQLTLQRMKKRRLALRDQIARLEAALDPREPA